MKTKSSKQAGEKKNRQTTGQQRNVFRIPTQQDDSYPGTSRMFTAMRKQGVDFEAEYRSTGSHDYEQNKGVDEANISDNKTVKAKSQKNRGIIGRADIYTDAADSSGDDRDCGYREVDSDTAKQLDEKYMQILQSKSGMMSDKDSIRTEDFEEKYKELLPQFKDLPTTPIKRKTLREKSTDNLPKTEVNSQLSVSNKKSCLVQGKLNGDLYNDTRQSITAKPSVISSGKRSTSGQKFMSDLESVRTEEFQPRFKETMVKQLATVPIINFDKLIVDSDIDTVASHMIRQKLQPTVTQKENYVLENLESDEDEDDEDESGTETLSDEDIIANSEEALIVDDKRSNGSATQNLSNSRQLKSPTGTRTSSHSSHNTKHLQGNEIKKENSRKLLSPVLAKAGSREGTNGSNTPSKQQFKDKRQSLEQSQLVRQFQPQGVDVLSLQSELFRLQSNIKRCLADKENLEAELKLIQDSVRRNQTELKTSNQQLKDIRMQSENARTELMLKEFKRDGARKELEHLNEQLAEKKHLLQDIRQREEQAQEVIVKAQELGITKEELMRLLSEKEQLKSQLNTLENADKQRMEAVKQLGELRDDIGKEQKAGKEIIDSLKKEVESRNKQLEELRTKLERSEAKYSQMECDKNKLIKEKTTECEELQKKMDDQAIQLRQSTSSEVKDVREQLAKVSQQLSALQFDYSKQQAECARLMTENKNKEEQEMKLREQVVDLKHQVVLIAEKKDSLTTEHQASLQSLQAEKELSLEALRKELMQSKQVELEKLRQQLEADSNQTIGQMERRFQLQLSEKQNLLLTKEAELKKVRSDYEQLHGKEDSIRKEYNEMMEMTKILEKKKYEESAAELERQLALTKKEYEHTISQLRAELQAEIDTVNRQRTEIEELYKDLEESRQKFNNSSFDRLLIEEEIQSRFLKDKKENLERMKNEIAKEAAKSLEALRETIRLQEDDLSRVRGELASYQSRHRDSLQLLYTQEQMIVNEINDECKRIAATLGTTPRLIITNSDDVKSAIQAMDQNVLCPSRSQMLLALTSLKSSNDDFIRSYAARQQEISTLKEDLLKVNKEKKDDIEQMKVKLLEEKERALDHLKNKLIKDHLNEIESLQGSLGHGVNVARVLQEKDSELREIQRHMNSWKEQTADKLAKKFQEEMTREIDKKLKDFKKEKKEWEREKSNFKREIEKMERETQRMSTSYKLQTHQLSQLPISASPYGEPIKAYPIASNLVNAYTPIQSPTRSDYSLSFSRNNFGGSVPDLAVLSQPVKESEENHRSVRQLESKVEQLETRAKLSEDKAHRTEEMLNQKVQELARVQSSFSQQNKEYLELQRAYSQLQRTSITSAVIGPRSILS